MPKFTEETLKKLKRMKQLYFVPIDLTNLLAGLIEVRQVLPSHLTAVADALEYNVRSITETLSLPFELASANAHNRHWQRISTAERIRAIAIDRDPNEAADTYEAREAKEATENARKIMREFLATDEGIDKISNDIADFLLDAHDRGTISKATSELIFQGVVLIWSSFEVFARDLFIEIINKEPKLVELLMHDPNTRKRFDITKISLDILLEHEFNVSNKMGSIFAKQQDLSDIRTIKSVLHCLFGTNQNLCSSIDDDKLWRLSQQRHLIVHKRGIVDPEYIKNTGDNVSCGSKLVITPKDLQKYIQAVIDAACVILRVAATERLSKG